MLIANCYQPNKAIALTQEYIKKSLVFAANCLYIMLFVNQPERIMTSLITYDTVPSSTTPKPK